MIRYTELESAFSQSDIIINEYNIETNEEIDLPYIVYDATSGETFSADGIAFYKTLIISLALIDQTQNFALQRRVESVLDSNGVYYEKSISFNDNARVYSIIYTFFVEDDANS